MGSTIVDVRDGLSSAAAIKGPCKVATTANITLSGHQTIDGVPVVTPNRVLVKNQTDARFNGLYIVDTGGWSRCKDFSRNDDVVKGTRVVVTDGTTNAGGTWQVSSDTINIDNADVTFEFVERISPADIAALTSASALTGTEQFAVIQSGNSRKSTISAIWTYIKSLLTGSDLATSGVSTLIGVDGSGGIVRANRQVFNVLDHLVKGDNSTDDAPAIQALINSVGAAGGGLVYFPKPTSRYKCNSTIDVSYNNVALVGDTKTAVILDFAGQSSGPGLRLGPAFDGVLSGIAILNAYGNCLEVATVGSTGPQTYAANGELRNLSLKGSRFGHGFYGSKFFMHAMDNIRAQSNALGGFKLDGYSTTLGISRCWATANLGDGWDIKNATYSGMYQCGADGNSGFGYVLQDVHLAMHGCGAEANLYSALSLNYDSTSTSIVKGLMLAIDNFLTVGNNTAADAAKGSLATFSSSPASNLGGLVRITGYREAGSPGVAYALAGTGAFKIIAPHDQNYSGINVKTADLGFSRLSNGGNDSAGLLPINITGANTKIGNLGPKMPNGLGSYAGKIKIHATQNNRGSSSRGAYYELTLIVGAGGMATLTTEIARGYTAGANAADASFTYSFDATTRELRASPVGSTATGNWYFGVSVDNDLDFVPA
jgi:hypothetical protein